MRTLLAALALTFVASSAYAETFPVITDKTVLKECGDCHMAFPPETLPKATWEKIIGNLGSHFGEDATLDAATAAQILEFHVKNASDVGTTRASTKWRTTQNVTRILDAPRFLDKHRQCPDAVWQHEQVKSKSNCLACHKTMQTTGSTDVNLKFLPRDLQLKCGEGD